MSKNDTQMPEVPEGENDEQEYIESKVGNVQSFAESLQRRIDGEPDRTVNQRPV